MPDKKRESPLNDDSEKLLNRLEENLNQIELDEIRKGLSREELEERGFIGEKDIDIHRKVFSETTEREKLSFKEGIEYKRLQDSENFESLTINSLLLIRDVEQGALIATREVDETIPFHAGENVKKVVDNEGEKYIAEVRGKAIIIKDTMYVFPSDIDCEISIRVSKSKMQAYMDCTAGYNDGKQLSVERVIDEMSKMGIHHGILKDAISNAITVANELMTPQRDVLVAEGTPPIQGADGTITYGFEIDSDTKTFKIMDDGRIDYKGACNIAIAKKDQFLATINDPGYGVDGLTVLGEVIPAEKGREAHLTDGQGVRVSDDGKSFYADSKGCIMLNPPLIEILDLYHVKGDVDYSTGSINFNGNVIINGTVREGFEVKADGDIIIENCVESARIIAGRDVRISGGILGQTKGLVSAGRDVYVEYVQNGRIEAQGTVYINDFSVNSYIFCNHLNMQKKHGSIVGGEVYAQRGIDVLNLGSPSGTKTYVTAGTDFLVRRKIKELDEALEFCEGNIAKIDATLKPLLKLLHADPKRIKHKTPIIKKTIQKRRELEIQQRKMAAKRTHLREKLEIEGICFIKVKQTCYSDVYIIIKKLKTTTNRKRENIVFYEDPKEAVIKTGAY